METEQMERLNALLVAAEKDLAERKSPVFNAAVGGVTPIGAGGSTALTINSTGTTSFEKTLATADGITQAGAAGKITFKDDIVAFL